MAGLRLPFPEIAWDFILFLMVASSQVIPNAWRYLFASYYHAPGRTRHSVPSVPTLLSRLTMLQGQLVVAPPTSPVCCIKC
jgi:hypothetical protein